MRSKILPVKNVLRLRAAGDALINRAPGMPGMGMVMGPTGYGKSTANAWYVNQVDGVYIRARALWSPKVMLASIAKELDIDGRGRNNGEMVDLIVQRLAETGRPLFIDEADYVVERKLLTDTLRDIHDLSTAPVVLIGMHGIERKIRSNPQYTGRIAHWVVFEGIDMEDARLLADGLCEVEVADDLLAALHKEASPKKQAEAGAEIRRLVVGLEQIEFFARSRGKSRMRLDDWPKDRDFFLGEAPMPTKTTHPGKVTKLEVRS